MAVSYTFLALSAVILSLSPVALTFYRLKQYDVTQTISMHIATSKVSYSAFALLFTSGSVLLYFLLANWLAPQSQLPALFAIAALTLLALQLVVAWLPDGKHIRGYIHRIASFGMALVMLILLFFIIFTSTATPPIPRTVIILAIGFMLTCIFLFTLIKKTHRYMLLFQAGYFAVFYVAILVTAFSIASL